VFVYFFLTSLSDSLFFSLSLHDALPIFFSVLPGGSCIRRHAWLVQPGFRMGNFVADRSRYLPDLSLLPALSGKTRRREAACGGDGQPPPANYRSAGSSN